MRIVITGGLGQLGLALQEVLVGHNLTIVDLPDTDITDRDAIDDVIRAAAPELVVHCAAYTDVDGCARNPELAYKVNALGTQNVVLACKEAGAKLLHISTNEVFAGDRVEGYEEWRPLDPINEYGRSKAMAETYVRDQLSNYYIVRTAWLYAPGGRNFIHAITAKARSDGEIRVVSDEIANPTYVRDLAQAIDTLIRTNHYGIYHFTNAGSCSRWEFANEILRLAGLEWVKNTPILAHEYERDSKPPPCAALHNVNGASIGITLRPWQDALAEYMEIYPPNND
jgi:dTDP-4-dehydrorhamnose reductase